MLYNLFIGKNIEKSKNVLFWTVASGIVYSLQSLVFLAVIQQVLKDETAGIYIPLMIIFQPEFLHVELHL